MQPRTASRHPLMGRSAPHDVKRTARLHAIGLALLALWLLLLMLGPQLLAFMGASLNAHGVAPLHAHGHPFIDARTLWGVPNAMDVLSNLPLALAGLLGLFVMTGRRLPVETSVALVVFFGGLVLAAMGSAWYHWAPTAASLVADRLGMAVVFAGALSLAVAERVGQRPASTVLGLSLMTAMISAVLPLTDGNLLPWAVVQFGGMALIAWAALQPRVAGALGVHLGALLAIYALAKVLELADAPVFHATGGWVSGHSLKHAVAALAAWPVVAAVLSRPTLRQNAAGRR